MDARVKPAHDELAKQLKLAPRGRVPGGAKYRLQKSDCAGSLVRGVGWGVTPARYPPPGKFLGNSLVSLSVRCRLAKWRMKGPPGGRPVRRPPLTPSPAQVSGG